MEHGVLRDILYEDTWRELTFENSSKSLLCARFTAQMSMKVDGEDYSHLKMSVWSAHAFVIAVDSFFQPRDEFWKGTNMCSLSSRISGVCFRGDVGAHV